MSKNGVCLELVRFYLARLLFTRPGGTNMPFRFPLGEHLYWIFLRGMEDLLDLLFPCAWCVSPAIILHGILLVLGVTSSG